MLKWIQWRTMMDDNLKELKHSIDVYTSVLGITAQLSAFLIKALDFIDSKDAAKTNKDMDTLSYSLIEATGVALVEHIDKLKDSRDLPKPIIDLSGEILIAVGKTRSDCSISSKNHVLKAISKCLKELGNATNTKYNDILDSNNNPL